MVYEGRLFCFVSSIWCVCVEIFAQGAWKELQDVAEEKGLSALSKRAKEVVLGTHAESTVKGYTAAFRRWKDWAEEFQFEVLPAQPTAVCLYLVQLLETSTSPSPVNTALAAIKWAHEKAGLASPVNSMTDQVAAAARRVLAQTPRRKKPLKKEDLAKVIDLLLKDDSCFSLRTAVMFAVGFAGFLRWDDLARIRVCDLEFQEECMEITLQKRKNDQLRQGSYVVVARQAGANGAVSLCEKLIREMQLQQDDLLLSNIVKSKSGWKKRQGSLQYSRARELFQSAIARAGLCVKEYGLHSLRSGGTTAAAAAKVPQRLIKHHGGWRSDAVNCYIQETLGIWPLAGSYWCYVGVFVCVVRVLRCCPRGQGWGDREMVLFCV